MSRSSTVDTIVLFGASGDLAHKMIFPALYRLEQRGLLDQRVIGVALEDWDDERFAQRVSQSIGEGIDGVDETPERRLLDRLTWVGGDYSKPETYSQLASTAQGESLHYLAIPPEMFETVVEGLHDAGLLEHSRILVEKPFARDLPSARRLNEVIHRFLPEERIHRIDHFLGKEPVENLLAFRYANPIFDAVWNRHHIDRIELTMAEAFGVEGRGALYETLGVVRDVVQNHLLQVVCLLTMEAPVAPDADALNDERVKVLRSIRTLSQDQVVYGQYEGYRGSPHVADDSTVPTYVALRLGISGPRWFGVPVYVRAGKAMGTTATRAVVVFRKSPPLAFSGHPEQLPEANRLVFRIGPDYGVDLAVQTKVPGDGVELTTTPLKVNFDSIYQRLPLPYETVLHDALVGNRIVFTREDAVEEAWRIVDPILDPTEQPVVYETGSWGPEQASEVLVGPAAWRDAGFGNIE
ncbi:MAG: glucose-6-phosphate dehydrogenase [Acidimicrobiia bacterium]